MYDQFGHDGPQGFGSGNNGYYSYSSSGFDGFSDFGDLGDIFSSFLEVDLEQKVERVLTQVQKRSRFKI